MKILFILMFGLFSIKAVAADVCRLQRSANSRGFFVQDGTSSVGPIDQNPEYSIRCSDANMQEELISLYNGVERNKTETVIKSLVEAGYDMKTETVFIKQ